MSAKTPTTNHRSPLTGRALFGRPIKHPLRPFPVVALAVAGAAHIPVIPAHLHEAPYIGVLFIVLTVASFALAAVIALGDIAAAYFSTATVMALALLAYAVSRTIGLPEIGDDIGNWLEPLGVVAVIAEATACLSAIAIGVKARREAGVHALSKHWPQQQQQIRQSFGTTSSTGTVPVQGHEVSVNGLSKNLLSGKWSKVGH